MKLSSFLEFNYWSGDSYTAVLELDKRIAETKKIQHVVTLNAEMMLHALEHPKVFEAIRLSDFKVIDTISVFWWMSLLHKKCARIPGIDLATEFIAKKNRRVALIGGSNDFIRQQAVEFVASQGSQVIFLSEGPRISDVDGEIPSGINLNELRAAHPDLILVGFGHGKQERWIQTVRGELNFPTIMIGVGGTIDIWGGKVRRAPTFMRSIGLEWLWRLFQEPRRLPRIFQAVIIFPCRALFESLL
ncbi:MAG: WecB/TagA/CpsF family glycosyltransferase [Candidatus Magasanikbacteria bacterium]|nr:WecB/TagA/CpsF family glycosyltransferase [Candidatus Magasanikbacteria bacterium]